MSLAKLLRTPEAPAHSGRQQPVPSQPWAPTAPVSDQLMPPAPQAAAISVPAQAPALLPPAPLSPAPAASNALGLHNVPLPFPNPDAGPPPAWPSDKKPSPASLRAMVVAWTFHVAQHAAEAYAMPVTNSPIDGTPAPETPAGRPRYRGSRSPALAQVHSRNRRLIEEASPRPFAPEQSLLQIRLAHEALQAQTAEPQLFTFAPLPFGAQIEAPHGMLQLQPHFALPAAVPGVYLDGPSAHGYAFEAQPHLQPQPLMAAEAVWPQAPVQQPVPSVRPRLFCPRQEGWLQRHEASLTAMGFSETQQIFIAEVLTERARRELIRCSSSCNFSGYSAEELLHMLALRGAGNFADFLLENLHRLNSAGFTADELCAFLSRTSRGRARLRDLVNDASFRPSMTAEQRRLLQLKLL